MNTEASKRLVTAKELGEVLGGGHRTVLGYCQYGRIPCIRLSGTTVRFDVDEVLAVLKRESKS